MLSSLTSFVQPFGIAPVGIVAVLSVLVIVGLVAGIYQEAKLRKSHKNGADGFVRLATPTKSMKMTRPLAPDLGRYVA
jgi:hypothetical protein